MQFITKRLLLLLLYTSAMNVHTICYNNLSSKNYSAANRINIMVFKFHLYITYRFFSTHNRRHDGELKRLQYTEQI